MLGQHHGKGTIATLGALAAAVVVTLFAVLQWDWISGRSAVPPPQSSLSQAPNHPPPQEQQAAAAPEGTKPAPPEADPAQAQPQPEQSQSQPEQAQAPLVPSFDIVRVEPDGESVIAGRAAAGATIELLRDGQVHARTAADPSGLFAFVPPPLPPGSHRVTLQSIAPDGVRQHSRDSVTIVVAANRDARPLVTLASPDRPTVVLSNPEPPAQTAQVSPAETSPPQATGSGAAPSVQNQPEAPPAAPTARPEIKIVSVEAEESGRLFVSGQAAPGATVRLYLNESFIAPGGVGGDGKVSFAIGRGMRPGDYRVRLDEVDPVSGTVRSRAEVAFNVPVQVVASAQPSPPASPEPNASSGVAASSPPTDQTSSQWAAELNSGSTALPAAPSVGTQVASAIPHDRTIAPGTVLIPDINTTIVSRGDNLWRISQRIYGQGYRYTVIFGANQGQIRNPNLIYPGQVFVLPAQNEAKAP